MSDQAREQRVADLEREVAELKQQRANGELKAQSDRGDWKSTIGMFDGDPVMKDIIEETLKVREEDRKRTRP